MGMPSVSVERTFRCATSECLKEISGKSRKDSIRTAEESGWYYNPDSGNFYCPDCWKEKIREGAF